MRGLERVAATATGFLIVVGCAAFANDVNASSGTKNGVSADVRADSSTDPDSDGVAEFPPSTERASFGAYLITITNGTPASLNNYRFRATLKSTGAEFADANPVQKDAATCVRSTDRLSIDCAVGYNGLIISGRSVSFNVNIKTPTLAQASEVVLDWNVRPGDGDASCYICATETVQIDTDALPGGNDAKVASSVPYAGYFLYTGINNIPNGISDKHTSAAKIDPVDNTLVFATITESIDSGPVCAGLAAKFCTHFSVDTKAADGSTKKAEFIPGDPTNSTLSQKLVMTLRFDKDAVRGLNISAITLRYVSDEPGATVQVVDACPSKSSNYVPTTANSPCIFSRSVLNGKFGKELQGDWEFIIFALKNGMFAFD